MRLPVLTCICVVAFAFLMAQTANTQGVSSSSACRVLQKFDQPESRDSSGRISVEAAVISVVDCSGQQFYIYQYVNRPGFRAIRPPDWGHALGGRDFPTFAEALAAAAAAAGGGGGGNTGGGTGGDVFGPMENNYALNGTNLTYYPRPSVDQCLLDCANNGNCRGFTWIKAGTYKPTDPAMCYLLSAVTGRSSVAGHISAVKGGSGTTGDAGIAAGGASGAARWLYRDGGFTDNQVFYPDGTAGSESNRDAKATWRIEGNELVVRWWNGWTNRYLWNPSAATLSGVAIGPGNERHSVTLTRQNTSGGNTGGRGTGGGVPGGAGNTGGGPTGGGAARGTPIKWTDYPLAAKRSSNKNGQRFTYTCPPNGTASPSGIIGTDIYTDDSAICLAAVHAGVISFASGGTVTVEVRIPGPNRYTGRTRNGVGSRSYDNGPNPTLGAFVFVP